MSTAIELESERKAADGGLAGRASGQHVEQVESAAQEDGLHGGRLSAEELAVEKKLLRKIDARIMPVVITIYLMNYIDRFVSLSSPPDFDCSSSADWGFGMDVGIIMPQRACKAWKQTWGSLRHNTRPVSPSCSSVRLSASTSQHDIPQTHAWKKGYIIAQVPSNILLNYIGRPSLYLGTATVCWGLVSTLTSQVQSYRGIVAARFFLGIVEAPFFPGALFYLSKWYTKEEMAKRNAIFFAGSLVSGAFGSLIAAGILSGLSGSLGMAAWQWYVGIRTRT
jgi:hypothetical protein